MENTRITLTPNMKKNLAMGHSAGTEVENWDLTTLAGAGGIRSTAVDMMKYLSANMGLTKSKLYPAIQLSHKVSTPDGISPMVGLGWHILPSGNKEVIAHNGGTGGYRTYIAFIKGEKKGVVVLSNSNAGIDDIGMHLLNPESPLKTLDKPVTVNAADLEKYVGKYELAQGFILTITRAEDQLQAQATGQPQFPIFPKGNHVFYLKVVEAQLTFNLNKDGVVESTTLNQGGQTIVGKRMP
jgi:CubicO group peptidase (beta-lactamase class C family)